MAGIADLDVTPVMNMFIILIPFLISMSAFTHLAAHEFSVPGNEGPGQASERHKLPLTIGVGLQGILIVQGDIVVAELPRIEGALDLNQLQQLLGSLAPDQLVVAVDGPVLTAELVTCLDACRQAGCKDVGLAAGTGVVLSSREDQS